MELTNDLDAVSPETVRWAYRFLLGREPESPAVIEQWRQAASFRSLREEFLSCAEFAASAVSGPKEAGDWAADLARADDIRAMLRLRDGIPASESETAELLATGPTLRALRHALLASPSLKPWLPEREGLRRGHLFLPNSEFVVTGDSREAEFQGLPGPAPVLAAVMRAVFPDGGTGRVLIDDGAGIGVSTLALAAGAPRHARLLAFEERLPQAAFLIGNLLANGLMNTSARAIALPPLEPLRAEVGRIDVLRLATPAAFGLLHRSGERLRGLGTTILLRFDLRALLLTDRLDPRAALRELAAAWPTVLTLTDPAEPRLLLGEDGIDALLSAALSDGERCQELVLCADPGWITRYSLV